MLEIDWNCKNDEKTRKPFLMQKKVMRVAKVGDGGGDGSAASEKMNKTDE
jgi:hypothetical protein